MQSRVKGTICSVVHFLREVLEELVTDHPWGWLTLALLLGGILGHTNSCRAKKTAC